MSNGYILIFNPKHPMAHSTGYVLQHRQIWFDRYGSIPKGHVVHHKNGNRSDNRISNLECLTKTVHMQRHYPYGFGERGGKPSVYLNLVCHICKKKFKRKKHYETFNKKVYGKNKKTMCSTYCNSVYMTRIRLSRTQEKQ